MDTNDRTPREGAEQNGAKKPYHKHHHRRRPKPQGENMNQNAEQEVPGGSINVRPGRYDLPPSAPEEPHIPVPAGTADNESAGESGDHKPHRRRPRHRRGGNHNAEQTAAAETAASAEEPEEKKAEEAPEPRDNSHKRPKQPKKTEASAEDAAEESAEAESDGEEENESREPRRRRRPRGRRRNHNREPRDQEGEEEAAIAAETAESDGTNAWESSAPEAASAEPAVSEYTLMADNRDAEIIDELNSITRNDAVNMEAAAAEDVSAEPEPELEKFEIVGVRFKPSGKIYYFDPQGQSFKKDDAVIVDTARGSEYGIVELCNRTVTEREVVLPLRTVERRATPEDTAHHEANVIREQEAMVVCAQKIADHNLQMKLIDVEYAFDNSKLLFYFTADGRVDFRELVKDLASVFRTRIELRQIGIRDETKLLGGIGICGRPFCCKTFLSDFVQVSIKMAKEQNLSLNSVKISGACGRLMCCLRYEYDTYQEEIRRTPKCDQIVSTPDGDGTVVEVQPLAGMIRVRFNEPDKPPKVFHRDQVKVIGGKGVKPKDLPKETEAEAEVSAVIKPE